MPLVYRFKKEKLENGMYVARPRILVMMCGKDVSIEAPALIDSGADLTIIPERLAKAIGLELKGSKSKMFAFRESSEVMQTTANITFLDKTNRETTTINIPVAVTLSKEGFEDEQDVVLGIAGVFDAFEITFKKSENRIILKKTNKSSIAYTRPK